MTRGDGVSVSTLAHRLAGDIAATSTFLELALQSLGPAEPARSDLEQALETSDRAMAHARELMASVARPEAGGRRFSVGPREAPPSAWD